MEQEGRDHAVVAPVLRLAVPGGVVVAVAGDVPAAAVPVRPPAAVQVAAVLARGVAEEAAEEAGEELRELNYIRFLCRFTNHGNYKCFPIPGHNRIPSVLARRASALATCRVKGVRESGKEVNFRTSLSRGMWFTLGWVSTFYISPLASIFPAPEKKRAPFHGTATNLQGGGNPCCHPYPF